MTPANSQRVIFGELIVVLALGIAVVWVALLRAGSPNFDEFYHILAARSWAGEGVLAIGDGIYDRAWLFTKGVGLMFVLFGESTQVARVLPAIGAVAWFLLVFAWARLFLGRGVAWVGALLLLFSAEFLSIAVSIRFYSWHGFFVFLGFFLVSLAVYPSIPRSYRAAAGAGVPLPFLVAYHLQPTTVIAVLGIAAWLLLAHLSWIGSTARRLANHKGMSLAIILAAGAAAFALFVSGIPGVLWAGYTHSALWNEGVSILTYHYFITANYPALWALFPVAAVVAAVYRPPFGLACVVIFIAAFLLHTFAGMRWIHYLFYAFPFFFMIGAIPLVLVSRWLYVQLRHFDLAFLENRLENARLLGSAWVVVLVAAAVFVGVNNHGVQNAFGIIRGSDPGFSAGEDWSGFSAELARVADEVDVVVVTFSVAGIYYLGDIDYVLSRTIVMETDTREEFGYDRRIGRHAISRSDSLRKIMDIHSSGMIVVDRNRWRNPDRGVDDDVIKLIESGMRPVNGLNTDKVMAFTWARDDSG